MAGVASSMPLEYYMAIECPKCGHPMTVLRTRNGVMSRLHHCSSCEEVWFVFGDRLFPCANADALVLPGQL